VCNQFEKVAAGGSFLYFDLGGGRCIRANPISERDLAAALVDSIADPARENKTWQIGGPGPPLSKLEQGALMAAAAGLPPPPTTAVPIGVLNAIVAVLSFLASVTRLTALEDAAEISRILRYYASEDMVAVGKGEQYGSDSVADFYKTVAANGREYDPYVAIFDSRKAVERFGRKDGPDAAVAADAPPGARAKRASAREPALELAATGKPL
jgi:divinyl chlorophyllide a 8-vinyl-reductase